MATDHLVNVIETPRNLGSAKANSVLTKAKLIRHHKVDNYPLRGMNGQ